MSWTSGPAAIVVGVNGSPSSDLAVDVNAWNADFSAELIGPLLPAIRAGGI